MDRFLLALKKDSFLTTTNRLDHLFDPTNTNAIVINSCFPDRQFFSTGILVMFARLCWCQKENGIADSRRWNTIRHNLIPGSPGAFWSAGERPGETLRL